MPAWLTFAILVLFLAARVIAYQFDRPRRAAALNEYSGGSDSDRGRV